jgi:AcrR family transcriptional regulator
MMPDRRIRHDWLGRIVEAAAELIYAKGAERVSLDEVMEATGASRSQLYHYFANKDDLVRR